MRRITLFLGLATALVASCSIQEENFETPGHKDVVFYASFEQPGDGDTKVYANEDLLLRWTADDRISIFNKNTYNQQYRFAGETGDNAGGFDKVAGSEFATGNAISHVVSVYPYQSTTKISESESLTLTLPAEQHYAENSFGPGASTMVSVTADNFLQYKTVGGYLRLCLYGDGVSVSSITLKGNDGEKLAGKATVTMPLDGTPTVALAEDATDQITLVCDTPVALDATAEESKDFWLVVPPVTFSKGFTITVSGKGGIFEKSTEKTVTIERNKLSKMAPIEVELTPTQPRNVIYYTSTDGNVVTPRNDDNQFGANILSNEYVDGLGVITFDGEVTSIGDYAFERCMNLTSITIPDSVTSIENGAFGGCSSLSSITIPISVTSIGNYAFRGCTSLTSIAIPNSVTSIGNTAFVLCSSLMSFSGKFSSPDGLFLIDSGALVAVAIGAIDGEVIIPDGVTSIGNHAFNGCTGLTSITIPDGVTSIGDGAFTGCTSLASITIPECVTSIGVFAFQNCSSLTSITIPNSVTSIRDYAFSICTSLTSITVPDSVTSIGDHAFWSCTSLTSITIPDGVTSIGDGAFSGCTSLASITILEGVTSIGNYAFSGCTGLTSITIPGSVTSIGSSAFNGCTGLTSITIPEGVTSIGNYAFSGCTSLTSIAIPNSVTSIGNTAFGRCSSLMSFSGKFSSPDGLFLIDSGALVAVAIGAIDGEVIIPDGVTSIVSYAFNDCTGLTSITIPDGVTSIGDCAFSICTSLTSITVPDSVTSIGNYAFTGCTSLASITVKPEVPPIGGVGMFLGTQNCPIYVPAGSIDAYKSAQYWSDYADRIQAIPSSSPSVPVPEAVDLGLPSGLKWASFNLGASKPEEFGDYYAWGEIEPYYISQSIDLQTLISNATWKEGKEAGYRWPSYKWCMGSDNTLTKYCQNADYGYNGFTDEKTVLDLEDDAAYVNLGGNWRMPTDAEMTELRENCTWTWTTQNGVYGHLVTGPNGNSIFLPAAGQRYSTGLHFAGSSGSGYYRSSSLFDSPTHAWHVFFGSGDNRRSRSYDARFMGFSIRPVCN